jgi:tetratricopeptide (TPR) repeat protein
MALDPYQICPCGSGKKIKFCCSKDIVTDLDKVIRAVQGEQRVAALDQITKLTSEKGPRLALLALRADVELALGQLDAADQTIDEFLSSSPDNPVALSLSAIHACHKNDMDTAVEDLQQALEHLGEVMPPAMYSAIGLVGQSLLANGDVLAARGHLLMQAGLAGDRDENPIRLLMRINMMAEVPLLLKQDHQYAECPEGVEWQGKFDAAMALVRRGAWLAACEALDEVDEKHPDQSAILKNAAILSGWLGQRDEATLAWRKYSRANDVPLADAVEAEALAQMFDPQAGQDEIDSMMVTYIVSDTDRLMELLLSDGRVSRMPIDPAELAEEGEPPPKAAFWLLDKPVPDSAADLQREQIPNVVGEMYVYGKQTDRQARLEFSILRDDEFEAKKDSLVDLAGDLLDKDPTEAVDGQVSKVSAMLTWRWRMPDETPAERRRELIAEQRRDVMLNRWPELTLKVLGDKTPREAAADATQQIPTLAAILLLELSNEQNSNDFDFNELRQELKLPTRDPLDPAELDAMSVSLVQIPLVQVEKLSDDDLLTLYRRVVLKYAISSIRRLAEEVLNREGLDERVDKNEAYDLLIRTATDSNDALRHVEDAKKTTAERGESPARWLLAELSVRLSRMETDECQKLVQTIQSRHVNEPGVAQGMYEILVSYGVISQDGTPAGPVPSAPPQVAATAQPAEPASKLWTPDSPEPAGEEQKSKLWVPGMD